MKLLLILITCASRIVTFFANPLPFMVYHTDVCQKLLYALTLVVWMRFPAARVVVHSI